jgi:hypothetical protein
MQELAAEERKRLEKDTELRETAEARNAVEGYVYDTRSDLNGCLLPYVLEADKDAFYSQLNEAEDWLYGEGAQATRQAYQDKLAQLKKVGEPIRLRRREAEDRDDAAEKLRQAIEDYRVLAQSTVCLLRIYANAPAWVGTYNRLFW